MNISELKRVKTHKVKAILDHDFTLDNRESIIDNVFRQIKEQGGIPYIDNDFICIKDCEQFFSLPKLDKERVGIIEFRSKDFIFRYTDSKGIEHKSYCNMPKKENMTDSGFNTFDFKNNMTEWILL